MKLGNNIILTLPEFRRMFKVSRLRDFWNARHQFIREMDYNSPRVCYWAEKDIAAFNTLKEWINEEDRMSATSDTRNRGIDALRQLSMTPIEMSEDEFMLRVAGLGIEDIIYAYEEELFLPEFVPSGNTTNRERIHKIEVDNSIDNPVSIYIGNIRVAVLEPGGCIYVTEIENRFVKILPNKKRIGDHQYELINTPGQYRSVLKKTMIGNPDAFYEYPDSITHFWFERGDLKTSNSEYLTN